MIDDDFVLVSAGTPIPQAFSLIRRYCGLPDEGGKREVWGYEYFDARPSQAENEVTPEDVAATAALNVRFGRETLEGFLAARDVIRDALRGLPCDQSLEGASAGHVELIDDLLRGLCEGEGAFAYKIPGAARAQVSKVLHRKRPKLVPLYDRVVSERYAFGFGDKRFGRGKDLINAIRDDLRDESNSRVLRRIQAELAVEMDGRIVPSRLRMFDIAIWMNGVRGSP